MRDFVKKLGQALRMTCPICEEESLGMVNPLRPAPGPEHGSDARD